MNVEAPRPPASEIIEPIAFAPSATAVAHDRRRTLVITTLAVFAVAAAVLAYLLFTAKSISFATNAANAAISIEHPLAFELGGVHLLRRGSYRVNVAAPGYQPFSDLVEIGSARNQVVRLELTPLPGRVSIASEPAGATVYAGAEPLGQTPLVDVSLPAGEIVLALRKPRYEPGLLSFEVLGRDQQQQESIMLQPDWAEVSLDSQPSGAEIHIDEEPTGVLTPGTVQVRSGEHEIKLTLDGHETFRRSIVVAAREPMTLDSPVLKRADASLEVVTTPAGAGIVIDGIFQGQTPVTLALKSGVEYRLRAFKAGYGDVTRRFSLQPGERRKDELRLEQLVGTLVVKTQPANAEVFIDGKRRDGNGSDTSSFKLSTRPHRVQVKLDGYAGYSTTVTPKAGLSQELRVKLLTVAEARLAALQPVVTAGNGQELVLIEPGEPFVMGASRREPGRRSNEVLRNVTLTRLYYLSRTEVTNAQYRQYVASHDSGEFEDQALSKDDLPVVNVPWIDAALYCNWLAAKDGMTPFYRIELGKLKGVDRRATGYRLPTEAEWSYAALQTDVEEGPLRFPWGARLPPPDRHGNYADRSAAHLVGRIIFGYNDNYIAAAPVASYAANRLGLFDLGGNVAEWMHDFYEIPTVDTQTDPLGPASAEYHVIKGSSWMHGTITDLRLSYRDYGTDGRADLGFRIARYAEEGQ